MERTGGSWRYTLLLACLFNLFGAEPFLHQAGLPLQQTLFSLALFMAALAPARNPAMVAVALVLGLSSVAASSDPRADHHLRLLDLGLDISLLLYALAAIVADVFLRSERVTLDKVFGALCAYLLLALVWAVGFAILEVFQPGTFHIPDPHRPFANLAYYSVITLTTVGYGDLAPRTDQARALAGLEAVTGQFYLSVAVARLVALQIMHEMKE